MGRLIDIDVLFDYFGDDAIDETTRSNIEYFVSEKGTVEAIPKADYENRLKADMVAMLTEIQLEIAELPAHVVSNMGSIIRMEIAPSAEDVYEVIQEKINSLKENKDAI